MLINLYDVKGLKSNNSIYRSVLIEKLEGDKRANVRVTVKAQDETYINALQLRGEDSVIGQIEKQFHDSRLRGQILRALNLLNITGFLVTYYNENGEVMFETYQSEDGTSEYSVITPL